MTLDFHYPHAKNFSSLQYYVVTDRSAANPVALTVHLVVIPSVAPPITIVRMLGRVRVSMRCACSSFIDRRSAGPFPRYLNDQGVSVCVCANQSTQIYARSPHPLAMQIA